MAALNITNQIPPHINTFEEILVWAASYIGTYIGSKTFNPLPDGDQTFINSTAIYPDVNGKRWMLISLAIPLAAGYAFDTSVKPWQHAEEVLILATPPDVKWTQN